MRKSFKDFAAKNTDIIVNKKIAGRIYKEITLYLKNINSYRIEEEDVIKHVRSVLKNEKIYTLSLNPLVHQIMFYLLSDSGFIIETLASHFDMVKKIIWSAVTKNQVTPLPKLDELTNAVIEEFNSFAGKNISTAKIASNIHQKGNFTSVSLETFEYTVSLVFDYFVGQGLIEAY